MPSSAVKNTTSKDDFSIFDDDDEGWQDMPIIKQDDFANGLDEEDQKKYKYVAPTKDTSKNATGNLIDFDDHGVEWRAKVDQNEEEYTRLRLDEENDTEEVHLQTKYLFDEDKAMTPLSQMQATKNLLTEAQRIAYVALCALAIREMIDHLKRARAKELKPAITSIELWGLKIMGRLYYHMELATSEQKMIESLAEHGVRAEDLVPSLMTTHTVANPEYDPVEARKVKEEQLRRIEEQEDSDDEDSQTIVQEMDIFADEPTPSTANLNMQKTVPNIMQPHATTTMPGVSTSLSVSDENVTLDIRWTVLCDLFLLMIADSVYDSRSRVLLELVAFKMGLGWLDVVKFEKRVTDALEIQEGVEKMEQQDIIEGRMKAARKRRYVMMGLATIGGGLVIGLSAGLLAPVIGAGLGAAFTTIGVTGTTGFFAGAGGAALITTGGALTGSGIAVKGMARRTRQVRTFELLPLHNNKRVNCIITVPGFMNSPQDDVRLPFSVLDPIVGDVFSVRWEPEMMGETGNALKILTGEILSQIGTTVLQATVMTTLMSALTWPIILTKLGYLIDNPWSNALDRAKAAGAVLADILLHRNLGVRPIMLIGFSLGARVIFYALLELAKQKAFGIVQDVFLLGATVTAPTRSWIEARGVVSGRFVNAYATTDWVLNYLFRATSGGLNTVAGLRPIENVPGIENVNVTDKIAGHMSYRAFMPLILDELGFPVTADYFDEPVEPDMVGDREIVRDGKDTKKRGWFSRSKSPQQTMNIQPLNLPRKSTSSSHLHQDDTDDLPGRLPHPTSSQSSTPDDTPSRDSMSAIPVHAGFDFRAIQELLEKEGGKTNGKNIDSEDIIKKVTAPSLAPPVVPPPSYRTESAPQLQVPLTGGRDSLIPRGTTTSGVLNINDDDDDDDPPPADYQGHDFEQSFSRSLSFNDVNDLDEEQDITFDHEFTNKASTSSILDRIDMNGSSSLNNNYVSSHSRGSSFGVGGGVFEPEAYAWSSEGTTTASSNDDVRFGESAFTTSSNGSDPTTDSRSTTHPSTLSFGAADNSLSISDPWATSVSSPLDPNKKPNYLANPW
ncbi:hypothetical protein Clacol_007475 [Clathrus columnatus]|uniref:DUF726-domain-containing protein n=1 Tax=Clathrus columnatus TaxID=1419009 RepID=A0AAV5AKK1_9AGAM|nr:hypothetical protein Clacol_007475 [Clathrus columnatus]